MKHTDTDNRQVAFFGRMTASITHEMKNVLAIIKESSGLMQDILAFSREETCPYEDKLKDVLHTIGEQITRGVELTSRLNRFAHDPDENIRKTDLTDQVEHLVALSQRFARLQNVVLKVDPPKQRPILIETCPVQLQMALFTGIECCLHLMETGGQIYLSPQKQGGKALIRIICEGDDPDETAFGELLFKYEKWPALRKQVEILGGSVEPDPSTRGISISLPEKIPV